MMTFYFLKRNAVRDRLTTEKQVPCPVSRIYLQGESEGLYGR